MLHVYQLKHRLIGIIVISLTSFTNCALCNGTLCMTVLTQTFFSHLSIIPQHHGFLHKRDVNNHNKISTAQRKILIVFVYYILLGVIALTAFTIATREERNSLPQLILRYFFCERHGVNSSCDRSTFEQRGRPELIAFSYLLIGLFPAINMLYVISIREASRCFRKKVLGHMVTSSMHSVPSSNIKSTASVLP